MAKEQTDYILLSIVAVVAIAAILAMYSTDKTEPVSLTGQVTSVSTTEGNWDYTGDGYYTVDDARLLADAIAFNRCPRAFDCDLNNDLELDNRDLEIYNSRLVEVLPTIEIVKEKAQPTSVGWYMA